MKNFLKSFGEKIVETEECFLEIEEDQFFLRNGVYSLFNLPEVDPVILLPLFSLLPHSCRTKAVSLLVGRRFKQTPRSNRSGPPASVFAFRSSDLNHHMSIYTPKRGNMCFKPNGFDHVLDVEVYRKWKFHNSTWNEKLGTRNEFRSISIVETALNAKGART